MTRATRSRSFARGEDRSTHQRKVFLYLLHRCAPGEKTAAYIKERYLCICFTGVRPGRRLQHTSTKGIFICAPQVCGRRHVRRGDAPLSGKTTAAHIKESYFYINFAPQVCARGEDRSIHQRKVFSMCSTGVRKTTRATR